MKSAQLSPLRRRPTLGADELGAHLLKGLARAAGLAAAFKFVPEFGGVFEDDRAEVRLFHTGENGDRLSVAGEANWLALSLDD